MLNPDYQDVFVEIFNTGIGWASDSLSQLLNTFVELQKPKVSFMDYESIIKFQSANKAANYINIVQDIDGVVQGKGIVTFPVNDGKTLIDILLENQTPSDGQFNDIEVEAITEVGNMVISSVASAIADMSTLILNFNVAKAHYSEQPIPIEFILQDSIYIVAETQFSISDLNISGLINLMFSLHHAETIAKNALEGLMK